MLCKDCGVFTSKQIIDNYKAEIELLKRDIDSWKIFCSDYNIIKQENADLKIVNKHLLKELKGSKKNKFLGIF